MAQKNQCTTRFYASVYSINEAEHTAEFYLMNTTPNRNGWEVTEKGLAEAAPTIKGKPIGMGVGYRIDQHYPDEECMNSGEFVAYQKNDSYLLATAKITDAASWQMLKDKKLAAVSVVITYYQKHCSGCNEDLMPYQSSVDQHHCIKEGAGHEVISSFIFHRVDFVDVPAYPQAGVLDMSAQAVAESAPLTAFASFYQQQNQSGVKNTPAMHVNELKIPLKDAINARRAEWGFPPSTTEFIATAQVNDPLEGTLSKKQLNFLNSEYEKAKLYLSTHPDNALMAAVERHRMELGLHTADSSSGPTNSLDAAIKRRREELGLCL
ncbi:MAG: hypothetical protein NWE93_11335 [Candidatus Bathyarchaeota archaeon]|nr:hypothetical protein [Candidatus Bathyarchaeota archaeon]